MHKTYYDLYDQWLDEIYEADLSKINFLRGKSAARLLKGADPTMYNCGFNDWLDGLELSSLFCASCHDQEAMEQTVDKDDISGSDDAICGICAGTHVRCEGEYCGEVIADEDKYERADGSVVCEGCYVGKKDEDEDEDNEENS